MTILLDTGVIFAFLNEDDELHGEAKDMFLRIAHGELGAPMVSDWVIAELLNLIRSRNLNPELEEAAKRLLPIPEATVTTLRLVTLAPSQLEAVWRTFEKHRARRLSFTDASLLVLQAVFGIDRLATFDAKLAALAGSKGKK